MSTWQFDPSNYTIRNISHGTWEIDLTKVKGDADLLYWILQAAQHQFNMPELFEEFRKAIDWCFNKQELNGAAALKDIYSVFPTNSGPVDWVAGKTAK